MPVLPIGLLSLPEHHIICNSGLASVGADIERGETGGAIERGETGGAIERGETGGAIERGATSGAVEWGAAGCEEGAPKAEHSASFASVGAKQDSTQGRILWTP